MDLGRKKKKKKINTPNQLKENIRRDSDTHRDFYEPGLVNKKVMLLIGMEMLCSPKCWRELNVGEPFLSLRPKRSRLLKPDLLTVGLWER